jgi:DNA-binding beta-propeller fold protein YncE
MGRKMELELGLVIALGSLAGCGSGPGGASNGDDGIAGGATETSRASLDDGGDGANTEPAMRDETSDDDGLHGPKFDVAGDTDGGPPDCEGEDLTFSYIWIANSSEGTVSKIDTRTGIEEGRYRTALNPSSPSRTSVNQFGDVAVGNRLGAGEVSKIAATEPGCVERNGIPGIQTSAGPADVLPYGEDECVIWSVPHPIVGNNAGPRAIAWEGGQIDPDTCLNTIPNPRLWVGYGQTVQEVYRLDGATGAVLDHITLSTNTGLIYGGAVNAEGDLWMVNRNTDLLIRVDAVTLNYDIYNIPGRPYGMGIDADGAPWTVTYRDGPGLDHVYRFDVATSSFVDAGGTGGYYRGMNLDRDGRLWAAANSPCRLAVFDATQDVELLDAIALPGCTTPVGVSIDYDGFVWVVDRNGSAYKLDPITHAIALTVTGLVDPYTYSDMTGAGLNLVTLPEG